MSAISSKHVQIISVLIVTFACMTSAHAAELWVIGQDGRYAVIHGGDTPKVLKEGSIWQQPDVQGEPKRLLARISNYRIHNVVTDEENNRLFVLVAPARGERYWGYAIFRLSDLSFLRLFERNAWIGRHRLVVSPDGKRLYMTYVDNAGDQDKRAVATAVYDAGTYERKREYRESAFQLDKSSCFVKGGEEIYANRRLFTLSGDEAILKKAMNFEERLGFYAAPIACESNRLLLVTAASDKPSRLVLYDFRNEKATAFSSGLKGALSLSWRLFPNGQLIIYEEKKVEPVGHGGKKLVTTGAIQLFDANERRRVGIIEIPVRTQEDNEIVGMLWTKKEPGGLPVRHMVYRSGDDVFIIDLDLRKIIGGPINMMFRPVGSWYR